MASLCVQTQIQKEKKEKEQIGCKLLLRKHVSKFTQCDNIYRFHMYHGKQLVARYLSQTCSFSQQICLIRIVCKKWVNLHLTSLTTYQQPRYIQLWLTFFRTELKSTHLFPTKRNTTCRAWCRQIRFLYWTLSYIDSIIFQTMINQSFTRCDM